MKSKLTILVFLITLIISASCLAQNGINYKAVVKDPSNNAVTNKSIDVRFTLGIFKIGVYQEEHTTMTDENGIIILNIGEGTALLGNFEDIPWNSDEIDLTVEIDTGNGFVDLGSTDFKYTPYAYYSVSANTAITAETAGTAEIAENVTGLEALNEGNGIGWRLKGVTPDGDEGYGDIGNGATDLSVSDANGASLVYPYGATGENSFASGRGAIAYGIASTAQGRNNWAIGDFSFAGGINNKVYGDRSFAFGFGHTINSSDALSFGLNNSIDATLGMAFGEDNSVSGSRSAAIGYGNLIDSPDSFAFGNGNTASGISSVAIGFETQALGFASFVAGSRITAFSRNETIFGQYNTNYTPQGGPLWSNSDRLFVVANGYLFLGNTTRRNALTILKNGLTGIGTDTPQERLHIANGRLRIGTETIEDTGSNQLSFNASLLPDIDNAMSLGASSARWSSVWAVDGSINTSDRRDKTNINQMDYGLDEVMQLQPVNFNWKNKMDEGKKLGLIAQDLLIVIPEVVKTHDWEYTDENDRSQKKRVELDRMGVYYSDLIPVLIKAMQEQQDMLQKRDDTILNLVLRVERLESGHN